MSILVTHSIKNRYGRAQYLFGEAHSKKKTNVRALAVTGQNIRLIHAPDGSVSRNQPGVYIESQFRHSMKVLVAKRRHSRSPSKRQAQSMIFSFSKEEFDTSDLNQQAPQALQLVQGYVKQYFGDSQAVMVVQCDNLRSNNSGDSLLHVHVLMNVVNPHTGRTIQTNRFRVKKLRTDFDNYMKRNYQKVTGKQWTGPVDSSKQRKDITSLYTKSSWQQHVKQVIDAIKSEVSDVRQFIAKLSDTGISVKERGKKNPHWTYSEEVQTAKGKRLYKARDFYQRKDKKTGETLSTRGLGTDYTKQSIEHYFKQRQKEKAVERVPQPLIHKHIKKDRKVDKNGPDEQLRQRAKQARVQLERQQQQQRQLITRITQRYRSAEEDAEAADRNQKRDKELAQQQLQQRRRQGIIDEARRNDQQRGLARNNSKPKQKVHGHTNEIEGPDF